MSASIIAVVGNPNCGKTTLFNALTGSRQRVGNWPGVTVERKTGCYRHEGKEVEVVDLPGIYSLDITSEGTSVDEKIARDYTISGEPSVVVNIVDASNLERNLYLTTQLLEMKVPVVVALNMMDIAQERAMRIDLAALAERLDCPVIPIVARRNEGIEELKRAISAVAEEHRISSTRVIYHREIEQAINELRPVVQEAVNGQNVDARWIALKLLEDDDQAHRLVGHAADAILAKHRRNIEEESGGDADVLLADGRYGFISEVAREAVRKTMEVDRAISGKIDAIVLNRVLGIPIFLGVMYVMFVFTINVGGVFIDFFDTFFGAIFVDGFAQLLASLTVPEWLIVLLAGGLGGGIRLLSTFIPIIGFLFLFLCFLEDSGYMARAAFVMDRLMRSVGLPGKSFVPMILGFGCNVPAIMATRTLDQKRDRILTIMMTPFMSCGARLPVYALFAAAFFPVGGQDMVFGLYLIGMGFAVLTGLVLKNALLRGEASPFVMELPPYHLPTFKTVGLHTWERLKCFMFRAGKVIIMAVLVLSFLNSLGTDGSLGNEGSGKSALSAVGRSLTPAFEPLGITRENWPATVGIISGIFAKEAVVGTLDVLYTELGLSGAGGEAGGQMKEVDLRRGTDGSLAAIPGNLASAPRTPRDPMAGIGGMGEVGAARDGKEAHAGTFGAMVNMFDGRAGAFAYLLFVLLYIPCVSALAAIYRETNLGWMRFAALWTTGLAWAGSTIFYQVATFGRHPAASTAWVVGLAGVFAMVMALIWWVGRRRLLVEGARAPVEVWGPRHDPLRGSNVSCSCGREGCRAPESGGALRGKARHHAR